MAKNPLLFGIQHYAGNVDYSATCLVEKNVSELPPECFEFMHTSDNYLLQQLTQDLDALRGQQSGAKKTVNSLFV